MPDLGGIHNAVEAVLADERLAGVQADIADAAELGIRGIPTLLIFKDGEIVERKVGADTKRGIVNWIEGAI